jgi:hypothetical protein
MAESAIPQVSGNTENDQPKNREKLLGLHDDGGIEKDRGQYSSTPELISGEELRC